MERRLLVCMPAYSVEDTVGYAIESVCASLNAAGLRDSEIMVVDNNSTDGTVDVIRDSYSRWCGGASKARLILVTARSSIPEARNICLDYARKEGFSHVVFWDSDVTAIPAALKMLIGVQDLLGCNIVAVDYVFTYASRSGIGRLVEDVLARSTQEGAIDCSVEPVLWVGAGLTLVDREAIGRVRFREDLTFRDMFYGIDAWSAGLRVCLITCRNPVAYDVNVEDSMGSNIYDKMSLHDYLRGYKLKHACILACPNCKTALSRLRYALDHARGVVLHNASFASALAGLAAGLAGGLKAAAAPLLLSAAIEAASILPKVKRYGLRTTLKALDRLWLKYAFYGILFWPSLPTVIRYLRVLRSIERVIERERARLAGRELAINGVIVRAS